MMKDFYCDESRFNFLFNEVSVLLSDIIEESSVAEGWLEDLYVTNRYNTIKAIEKYTAEVLMSKMKKSNIPKENIVHILDKRLDPDYEDNVIESNLEDKLYTLDKIKNMNKINESTIKFILDDFELSETISYIKENYLNEDYKPMDFSVEDEDAKKILNILESIKQYVLNYSEDIESLKCIQESVLSLLYKYKSDVTLENSNIELLDEFVTLENLLKDQTDEVIEYTISELYHMNDLLEYFMSDKLLTKKSDEKLYKEALEVFDTLVESIFLDESDDDMNVKDLIKLYKVTEALCEYESNMEASSRIITKGTEKVTKSIGKASSKSHGMAASDSKLGQIKRGAKIIDDRASDAINRKLDDIMNFTRDQKREKLITGKNTVKLGKSLKTLIKVAASAAAMNAWKGPIVGTATTIIGLLAAYALSKRTEEREKKRILLELETELKIVKEKIEDAKGDNVKEQKYQLMRIQSNLEKEIMRIKHGMRYY